MEPTELEHLATELWQLAKEFAFYILACVVIGAVCAAIYYLRH